MLLETLAPKNRVEELENEVAFLKSVMKLPTLARIAKALSVDPAEIMEME